MDILTVHRARMARLLPLTRGVKHCRIAQVFLHNNELKLSRPYAAKCNTMSRVCTVQR